MMMISEEMEMDKDEDEMQMQMKTRAEDEGEGNRVTNEREERTKGETERQRERRKRRHGPQTPMLLREPLSRSHWAAWAAVQASAFKALASLALKKNAQRFAPLVRVSRRVERDRKKKKKNACT